MNAEQHKPAWALDSAQQYAALAYIVLQETYDTAPDDIRLYAMAQTAYHTSLFLLVNAPVHATERRAVLYAREITRTKENKDSWIASFIDAYREAINAIYD